MLLLDLLMDALVSSPEVTGPLAPAESAWQLLVAAQHRDTSIVDETLLRPETGMWLARVVRRLQVHLPGAAPLWVDAGQLHAVAAATAVRTGLDFRLTVPARSGTVWLPGLGRAVLPGLPRWDTAEVTHTVDGRLIVNGGTSEVAVSGDALEPSADGWQPTRRLALPTLGKPTTPADEVAPIPRSFHVVLDDISHHRVSSPLVTPPPKRLPEDTAAHWADILGAAWAVLVEADPQSASDVSGLLRTIEPLPTLNDMGSYSASAGDGVGRIALTEPTSSIRLAAVLAHEVQHSKLSMLMHLYPLHEAEAEPRFYAPWRSDPRPLRGMLQGVYAFTAVARFWRGLAAISREGSAQHGTARFEFALVREQLQRALPPLRKDPELTPLGQRLVQLLAATTRGWQDDRVPPRILTMARDAVDDHTMLWRLHHLVADRDLVTGLAEAWLSETTSPMSLSTRPTSRLQPNPEVPVLDIRAALLRLRLTEPALLNELGTSPLETEAVLPGITPADVHLALGNPATAMHQYAAAITATAQPAEQAAAWAGLALSLRAIGQPSGTQILFTEPELVREVHQATWQRTGEPPHPIRLTRWLDDQLAMTPRIAG